MEKNTVFIAGKTAAEGITASTGYFVIDPTTGALLVSGGVSAASTARKGSVTLTRPATTPTYAAGAAIGDANGSAILEFTNFGIAGDEIIINTINLGVYLASSAVGTLTLHLFNAAPTAIADAAVFDLFSADRSKYLGFQQLFLPTDLGSTLWSGNKNLGHTVILAGTSLFAVLVTDTSFIASASAVKKIDLHGFRV